MSKLNLYENLIKENLQSRLNLTGTVGSITVYSDSILPHLPQVLHRVWVKLSEERGRTCPSFLEHISFFKISVFT